MSSAVLVNIPIFGKYSLKTIGTQLNKDNFGTTLTNFGFGSVFGCTANAVLLCVEEAVLLGAEWQCCLL